MGKNKHYITSAVPVFSCMALFFLMTMLCAEKLPQKDTNKIIVATVNDRPIYKKELTAGIPAGLFAVERKRVESQKLERLIYVELLSQFLSRNKILVSSNTIDKEIAELRKNPPSSGCSCCRYESLEQFLEFNYFTLEEFKELIKVNMGLSIYIEKLWTKEAKSYIASNKQRIEAAGKAYCKAYHIFFNVFQDPDYGKSTDKVIAKKKVLATAAWKRLEKGESFEQVARDVSDDSMSANAGGFLGVIPSNLFGMEFDKAVRQLPPGKYSKPVLSLWGYHIIKKDALDEKDIEAILKDDFFNNKKKELLTNIRENAAIELKKP
jgi:hypothetical protein